MDLDEAAHELYDLHRDELLAYRKARHDPVWAEGDPGPGQDDRRAAQAFDRGLGRQGARRREQSDR